jgi:hypothetical protein
MVFLVSCGTEFKNQCLSTNDNYKFISVSHLKKIKKSIKNYDVIKIIKESKQVKGPIKGIIVKEIKISNTKENDTLTLIVYGLDNKLFSIKNCYYESEIPVVPINIFEN